VDGVLIRKLSLDAIGCLHLFDAEAGVDDESANMQPMLSVNLDSFIEWSRGLDPTKRSLGMELYQKRVDLAAKILQDVYGSHAVDNAFARADFGADSDIHQATMADLMHAMEEGIFVWVTSNLIGVLSNKHKERLDGLVDLMFCQFGNNRSGKRPNYPRVNFTRGFSKLTLLTCDERVGILFVVALLLNTRRGREILQVRFAPEFDVDHERATDRNRSSQAQDPPPKQGGEKTDTAGTPQAFAGRKPMAGSKRGRSALDSSLIRRAGVTHVGAKDGVEKDDSDIIPQLTGFQHDLLLRLDLQYLMDYCYPTLPDHHQAKLLRILTKDLRVNKHQQDLLSRNPSFKLPARLGYKNPQSLHAPPTDAQTLRYGKPSMIPPIRLPDDRKEFSLRSDINGTARLLEQLLAFHAFAKYGGSLLSTPENVEKYEKSFLTMMNALKECSARRDEHGGLHGDYKIQKFLECLHLQKDHMRYGPTVEHNSDTGERGLKFWAKLVAVTAQNRGDNIFKNQVARNTQEVEMLDILETSYLLRQGKMPGHIQEDLVDADGPLLIGTMGKNFCFSYRGGIFDPLHRQQIGRPVPDTQE
jgi:hypothetical protein